MRRRIESACAGPRLAGGATASGRAVRALCVTLCAASIAQGAFAQGKPSSHDDARKNWYGDPFFALSAAAGPACPTPLGPRMSREEADSDAHYRVERGTSCWLAHRCSKPNSYMYDADIAKAIRKQLHDAPMLAGTSLWVTVQRRFVYVDGCVPASFDRLALQRRMEQILDVDRVFVRVTSDPHALLPYPTPAAPR
ncbi:MAG TPA: BON domain-containing protein [Paraburkholderia sp.]|jgi:hypothetical protein|nr:BON domain-containing protein [Paraburkholderia sp.]